MEKLEWSALEYEERERGNDWFLALGIIVAASSVAATIYSNYFFATLLVLSGLLLGSFAIKNTEKNSNLIKKRNVILIDDIITTGATLAEAKKILKQAGARKIIAFTVAH